MDIYKNRILAIAGLIIALFIASSCGDTADERPVIAVSIEPQRYILEQLVGDHFKVVTIMPSSADPEAFEPSLTTRADIDRSKAYFTMDILPFELALKLSIDKDVNIVDIANDIEPLYGTHGHVHTNFLEQAPDSSDCVDPHYWGSVKNMRIMTRCMAEQLQRLDPDNAAEYQERYVAVDHKLDSLDMAFAKSLAQAPNRSFIVWHPTLSYFARDYDLEQLAVSGDNKEVSIGALRHVIDEAKEHGAQLFINQGYCNAQQAATIRNSTGANEISVNISSYDWPDQLKSVVDELSRL